VTDTGIGMTPQVLTRVFEPFFTTKPPGKGTGLGLAQVYGFARQSGGTARAESDPAQGTTVAILLPRSIRNPEQAVPAPLAPMRPPRGPAPEHLSVLVVEDDDEVAAVVLEMLDQLGHRGLRVSSLPAAVAVLSGSDCIDLIFSDVLLGTSGSGLDLAREVARRNLQIPLVLTSGYGGGVTGRLAAARLPFLRKPYTIEALRSTLSEALDSEREPAT
jgi:CheY-like chemotaxis protein